MENDNSVPAQFYYKKSRIQQLKGFCNTVQLGTAKAAAEKMGLDPTAITFQIKSLEEDLGIKLFERLPSHRLKLTKEGKTFYDLAVIQIQGMDGLFSAFHSELKEKNKNTLIIAGYYTVLSYILPKYIRKLVEQKEFKDIKIKLCNIDKEEAFNRLKNNKIDFAFYPSVERENEIPIEIQKDDIFKLKTSIFMHNSNPLAKKNTLTLQDIKQNKILILDKYAVYDPRNKEDLKKSNIEFENGNVNIMLGLIKENLAIGGASEVYLNDNLKNDDITYKNVDNLLPKMFYSVFTLKNKKEKISTSFFINELQKDKDI